MTAAHNQALKKISLYIATSYLVYLVNSPCTIVMNIWYFTLTLWKKTKGCKGSF